jgi:flagellar basal body-associated protein FliL
MKNKHESNDNTVAYIAVIVVAAMIGLLLAWGYMRQQQQNDRPVAAFASLPTFRFQGQSFTVRTTVALQTSMQDAAWVVENKKSLQKFVETTLEKTDAKQLSGNKSDKLPNLQDNLTEAINKKFPEANVQQVLFTEFLTSPD